MAIVAYISCRDSPQPAAPPIDRLHRSAQPCRQFTITWPPLGNDHPIFRRCPVFPTTPVVLSCRGVISLFLRLAHALPFLGIGSAPTQVTGTGFFGIFTHGGRSTPQRYIGSLQLLDSENSQSARSNRQILSPARLGSSRKCEFRCWRY